MLCKMSCNCNFNFIIYKLMLIFIPNSSILSLKVLRHLASSIVIIGDSSPDFVGLCYAKVNR